MASPSRARPKPKTKTAARKRATGTAGTLAKRTASAPAKKRSARPARTGMLSKTTVRAKWIENADEHEDRPGQSLATRDHDVIMQWASERGAEPATVASTRHDDRPGVLRFDFPGYGGGRRLRKISWEEWFRSFDGRNLVFVFQEHLKKGNQSNFFRLDNPEREEG